MIETPRLILRQWRDADRAPFGELSADAEVMRFFPAVQTQAEADAVVDRAAAHIAVHGWGMWAVERRADGAFAGIVGLQPCNARGPVLGEVEVGWRIMKPLWRQGIALEAARAALDFGLQRLGRRIVAITSAINLPSQGVMERLGMTRREDLDFDHFVLPEGSPLRRHVTYMALP